MEERTYFTANEPVPVPGSGGGGGSVGVSDETVVRRKARTGVDRIVVANLSFFVTILLLLFLVVWCTDLPSTGFYFGVSVYLMLLATDYWRWTSAQKSLGSLSDAGTRRRLFE